MLVLLRHGQSEWNRLNIFTGWVDVPLSSEGEKEAEKAAQALKDYQFDAVFTSTLSRAQKTAQIVMKDRNMPPVFCSEALNERRYGDLEGKNKDEMRKIYGKEQIHIWRRSFSERPPKGESLKDTCERVLPYYKKEIEPRLLKGQSILICAHGNSLRALIKYLEHLSDESVVDLEIPTGVPIVYRLNQGRMEKITL
jgi:2,3-bisphosphoglycerate-dependent phosphoglycerate mutase